VPPPPADSRFAGPGVYLYHKDISQGRVSVLLPGILRDDPDYFPILVMNDILGGGGFTSRITHRVRTEEGLAYDAGSRFDGGEFYPPPFRAFLQTKSASVARATAIVFEEMKRIATEPVSDAELATTRQGIIDRFPAVFGGKARVAERFAHDEITGRYAQDPDFWQAYRQRVAAVTQDDVRRVAARHLDPAAAAVLIVGDEPAILAGDPGYPDDLKSLSPAGCHRLPPRDPLTLQRSVTAQPAP
jgi:zinc protease